MTIPNATVIPKEDGNITNQMQTHIKQRMREEEMEMERQNGDIPKKCIDPNKNKPRRATEEPKEAHKMFK